MDTWGTLSSRKGRPCRVGGPLCAGHSVTQAFPELWGDRGQAPKAHGAQPSSRPRARLPSSSLEGSFEFHGDPLVWSFRTGFSKDASMFASWRASGTARDCPGLPCRAGVEVGSEGPAGRGLPFQNDVMLAELWVASQSCTQGPRMRPGGSGLPACSRPHPGGSGPRLDWQD